MSLLKDERERTGRELSDVAEATRIRSAYLKAIEESDFKNLPAEVYTRSYIKDYAKHLGVNPEAILNDYERFLANKKMAEATKVVKQQTDSTADGLAVTTRGHSNPNDSLSRALSGPFLKLFSILIVMGAVGFFFYWSQSRVAEVTQVVEYKPPAPIAPVVSPEPIQVPEKAVEENIVKEPVRPFKHSLNIIATEKVWLQVLIDGKEKKEMTLNPGDNLSYSAHDSFNLLIGNAGGVQLRFNDKPLDKLGESGAVIKIRLPQSTS